MCETCGCSKPAHHHGEYGHSAEHQLAPFSDARVLRIEEDLLASNNRLAARNRKRFEGYGILVLNLVSSPGSGKTSLLERTLENLKTEMSFAVLEGDQQTSNDAERIAAAGVPVRQINTGAGCHLDAHMVEHGLEGFDLDATEILMIENVGNLVCPAAFDLGEDHKVVVFSVTEGEDKPLKYPHMFRAADVVLLHKIDLLPYLNFDLDKSRDYVRQINPGSIVLELSCLSGEGMGAWYDWLRERVAVKQTERKIREAK